MNKRNKLIRIATAGSVDNGKSTLIGRLLYDTKSLASDKIEAIRKQSAARGYDYLDFSLATDGLVAEREQGITIDVAHIYFATPQSRYIIADTPGHEEYTRNMVTGASTSDVALILVDARKGITEQTIRHFYISHLLRMQKILIVVNKMDLVDYSQDVFDTICYDFKSLLAKTDYDPFRVEYLPISALYGENVISSSLAMPWYEGSTMLSWLDNLQLEKDYYRSARFQVQYVLRPKTHQFHDFRGLTGMLTGSNLRKGDKVTVLPGGKQTVISSIHFHDQEYLEAEAGSSITLVLEDDLDVSRGDMIVKSGQLPQEDNSLKATLCQVNKSSLKVGDRYILQAGVKRLLAKVEQVTGIHGMDFTMNNDKSDVGLNEIADVVLRLNKPVQYDPYEINAAHGSFILIDESNKNTVSVGFIR